MKKSQRPKSTPKKTNTRISKPNKGSGSVNWQEVVRLVLLSRAIDSTEEKKLYPEKKIAYQFSARGHELGQIILGLLLDHPKDGASAYYRSRPLLLSLGLSPEDAFAGPLGKSGGFSDGRDIGVVCNLKSSRGVTVLPMAGDVGSQYTPAAGWADGIRYHREVLKEKSYQGAISVVFGGEGSVASNGFWSALTLATTASLPLLFFIEDNGYAISVPADKQTPGGDIVQNLRSFQNLALWSGDGTKPLDAAKLITQAVSYVRKKQKPALIKLTVPRLSGHSGQDSQSYKKKNLIQAEQRRDPLRRLYEFAVPKFLSKKDWEELEESAGAIVGSALKNAETRPEPNPAEITEHVYSKQLQESPIDVPAGSGEGPRLNMGEAICRTLESELRRNPKMLLFGEDIAAKGGVHAVTLGLQEKFGERRVFDTSLSEEGIIGRAVGLALQGLLPVPEIQFRKYADPATEQLNNCGTIRWRTNNKFSSPMVVRLAGGFSRKAGDPWHSVSGEAFFAHAIGWRIATPANAKDAVGLLRTALRGDDPTVFFEHRALLDAPHARMPYPGNDYCLPFGKGKIVRVGQTLTLISWGGMVERCLEAAESFSTAVEVIDLRTICPWDRELVLESVVKTHRCLIVHEDGLTAGFGAEISAVIADEAFRFLDAPIRRLATPDIPIPYNVRLMEATLPTIESISKEIRELLEF